MASPKIIESGDIYFLYRPAVEEEHPKGTQDIQRFYVILEPKSHELFRMIVIGRKKLPDPDEGDRYWGYVELVGKKKVQEEIKEKKYPTKTRGERTLPEMRPAGEGRYNILSHENHTHLAYVLELPKKPGEVQSDLNIEPEASYVISVKNPEASSPSGAGLNPKEKVHFPKKLQDQFRDRRFLPINDIEFINYEGAEVMLVGASEDLSQELGIRVETRDEQENNAKVFNELRLPKTEEIKTPLFKGEWE